MLELFIQSAFKNWEPLDFALQQNTAGSRTFTSVKILPKYMFQYFEDHVNFDSDDIADHLYGYMNNNLNILADDGSVNEMADMLFELYELCRAKDSDGVSKLLSRLPTKTDTKKFTITSNSDDESDDVVKEEDEEEEMDLCGCQILEACMADGAEGAPVEEPQQNNAEGPRDSDGWTVVGKQKK